MRSLVFSKQESKVCHILAFVRIIATTWKLSLLNKLGRFAQGTGVIVGNGAIDFTPILDVLRDRNLTYVNMVCNYIPLKSDSCRGRLTVGGDTLEYLDDAISSAVILFESNLIFNSTISDASKG